VKAASPELIALLAGIDQYVMADLYTITLVGGSVRRYSAAPTALSANGYTFTLGPKFERSKTKVVIGTQVDELEVNIYPEPTDLIGGVPFLQAAWQGQLDGALLRSSEPSCRVTGTRAQERSCFSPDAFRISNAPALVSTSSAARISNC